MKFEIIEKDKQIKLTPENEMDYFKCGQIYGKLGGLMETTYNTDDTTEKLRYIKLPLALLIQELLKK